MAVTPCAANTGLLGGGGHEGPPPHRRKASMLASSMSCSAAYVYGFHTTIWSPPSSMREMVPVHQ